MTTKPLRGSVRSSGESAWIVASVCLVPLADPLSDSDSAQRSSTGDRYVWPSVVEAVGRASHGVPSIAAPAMRLILGQARPKKLHKGHGLPTTRAWVRLHRPTPGG